MPRRPKTPKAPKSRGVKHATIDAAAMAQRRRTRYTQEEVRDALIEAKGEQHQMARILHVSRSAITLYMDRWPELREIQRSVIRASDDERFSIALEAKDHLLARAMRKAKTKTRHLDVAERQAIDFMLIRTKKGRERFATHDVHTVQALLPSAVQGAATQSTPWLVDEDDPDLSPVVAKELANKELKAG